MFRDPCLHYHIIMLKINFKGKLTLVFWFIKVKYLLIRINEKKHLDNFIKRFTLKDTLWLTEKIMFLGMGIMTV